MSRYHEQYYLNKLAQINDIESEYFGTTCLITRLVNPERPSFDPIYVVKLRYLNKPIEVFVRESDLTVIGEI